MLKSDVKQQFTITTTYTIGQGTGMIASSGTFHPHSGRLIRDLFRLLHAVGHGTEALQQS